MSRRLLVAASRDCISGFGLYARFDMGVFFSVGCEAMLKSNNRGTALTDRSASGEGRGGV
jgi:hypothetical protein